MTWIKLTERQVEAFEKKAFLRALKEHAKSELVPDRKLKNVKTNQKVLNTELTEENFTPEEYPFFGYNPMTEEINSNKGLITRLHSYYLSDDGFYYCRALEDAVYPEKSRTDDKQKKVKERDAFTINFSSIYNGLDYEGNTDTDPDFTSPVTIYNFKR